jgi:hypothetical protein
MADVGIATARGELPAYFAAPAEGAPWPANRLERALSANRVEHDVKEYPDAGHASLNNHKDDPARPLLLRAMGTIMGSGAGYHEPSARDARRRIISFFDAYLKSPEPPETGTRDGSRE